MATAPSYPFEDPTHTGPPLSLVQGTQLARRVHKRRVTVWESCGEATITPLTAPPATASYVPRGQGSDPTESAARSSRRRKVRMRRYSIHNRFNMLWTNTYAIAEWDPATVKKDINRFIKRLRRHLGSRFAYLWVIEEHPGGHGLHVHFAMRGFIRKSDYQQLWGHGVTSFSKRAKDARQVSKGAQLAAYLAKELAGYIAKGSESEVLDGNHFYDVGQGFQPEVDQVEVDGNDVDTIGVVAREFFGGERPHRVWCSDELGEQWTGLRTLCLYWYGRSE